MTRANKVRALIRDIDKAKKEAEKWDKRGAKEWETAKTEELLAYAAACGQATGYADGIRHALEVLKEVRP